MIRLATLCLTCAAAFACMIDYTIWTPSTESADPLYRFIENGKIGFIDQTGKIVIQPTLKEGSAGAEEFHDGLLVISYPSRILLDREGKSLQLQQDLLLHSFREGLAVASQTSTGRTGFVDKSGRFVIEPRFTEQVHDFAEGLAQVRQDYLYGYIDRTGAFVIPPNFVVADEFSEGLAAVSTSGPCRAEFRGACSGSYVAGGGIDENLPDCTYEYIDRSGRIVTTGLYEVATPFREGLASVRKNRLYGFIDKRGNWIIKPHFTDADSFSNGLARVRVGMDQFGFVDRNGNWVLKPQYRYVGNFLEGLAEVKGENGTYYYIDRSGKRAFEGEYTVASPFHKGLAHVQLKSDSTSTRHYAYIDKTGRIIFKYSTNPEGN